MNLELVVEARSGGVWIALLREGKLIELQEEQGKSDFSVGDIYLGKVRKLVPSLNAAFVDVGYEKDAFLHYLDLGAQFINEAWRRHHDCLNIRKKVLSSVIWQDESG